MRHRQYFWEKFQARLNELLLIPNAGQRGSSVILLDDEKKHADFLDKDHARYHEGLKLVTHPSLRKGAIGHAAVPPITTLARAMSWEKSG